MYHGHFRSVMCDAYRLHPAFTFSVPLDIEEGAFWTGFI